MRWGGLGAALAGGAAEGGGLGEAELGYGGAVAVEDVLDGGDLDAREVAVRVGFGACRIRRTWPHQSSAWWAAQG